MSILRKRLLQLAIPLLVVLLLAYTANQLLNGERGIFSWRMLNRQVEDLQAENITLKAAVERLKAQVSRLKAPRDEDYMDELVRRTLPMGKKGEVVILVSPSGYGGSMSPTVP